MTIYKDLAKRLEKLRKLLSGSEPRRELVEAIMSMAQAQKILRSGAGRKVFTEIVWEMAEVEPGSPVGFALEALQKTYNRRVRGKMSFPDEFTWLMQSRSKYVEELRALMLGIRKTEWPEFIKGLRQVLELVGVRHFDEIVRTAQFEKLKAPFAAALDASKARVDALIARNRKIIEAYQRAREIPVEDLIRIKGEIAEVISLEMKNKYLARIQKDRPNARLFEDVAAKTSVTRDGEVTASKAFRKIWDGVIGEVTDSGLVIYAKFEIKSGAHGFAEGFEQILSTQYSRFKTFGDELRVVVDGVERTFRLGAPVGSPASIRGADAANVLITPLGVSSHLPNQVLKERDFVTDYLVMKLDDIELDHFDVEALVMDWMMKLPL